MRKSHLAILTALAAPISLLAFVVSSPAQPLLNGQAVGDWKFECLAISEQVNRCALTQVIMYENGSAPLARISLRRDDPSTNLMISILTPLSVDLARGVALVIGEDGIEFPYITCVSEGCLARGSIEGEVFRNFITSDEMGVAYTTLLSDGVTVVPASARGLIEALDRTSFGAEN